MPEGYATWESERGWDVYYKTDGMRHGEVYCLTDSSSVTRKRFDMLKRNRLIPQNSVLVEVESQIKGA